MIEPAIRLNYYKREEIRAEMILHARGREVAARFGEKFGSRPDVLNNQGDILEFAKQGASSFHCSEELWRNPLLLKTEMRKEEQDNLRTGWDLVIDVDCPVWEYSKLITHFIVQALRENGVLSISCKFSGNKGFHVGVPFEAFPKLVNGQETRLRFPDGVRIIASFLVNEIDKNERFTRFILDKGLLHLLENIGMKKENLVKNICARCGTPQKEEKMRFSYICPHCERQEVLEVDEERVCPRCKKIMEKRPLSRPKNLVFREEERYQKACMKCKGGEFSKKLDIESILSVDSLLISSRHLYRMPYSLHEKSGLVSLPISPDEILNFEREMAKPSKVMPGFERFLDREKVKGPDASMLFDRAFQWHLTQTKEGEEEGKAIAPRRDFEITEAIPADLFPPCIKLILNGIGDGKKRAVFILINFLRSVGYDYAMIEKMIMEWNKKNKEPMREVFWRGQLNYHRQQNKSVLPPNCQNTAYMVAIGVCRPDGFCQTIKNPAQYAKKKAWMISRENKGRKKKIKNNESQK